MNNPERIIIVEIKTMTNPGFDSEQFNSITVYQDGSNYHLTKDFHRLESVMIEAIKTIINLGNNFRHPLYFNVQIVPGDGINSDASPNRDRDLPRRKRRPTTKN